MLRSRHEIIADILAIATQPVNNTTIIYGVHLSNEQFKLYIRFLQERAMIERIDNTWLITDKGRAYVSAFSDLVKIFEESPEEPGALSPLISFREAHSTR